MVVWSKSDRDVAVVDGKIVYTKNQKETLDCLEKGMLPYDSPEFKMLYDILHGKHELRYRAKAADVPINIEGIGIVAIADTPMARFAEAVNSLLGAEFARIFLMTFWDKKEGRKMAEKMHIRIKSSKS